MAKSIRDFEGMIGKGEMGRRDCPPSDGNGPSLMPSWTLQPPADGFQAQTVNGTARATGTGWNGDRWGDCGEPELPPGPTRPAGRSNRTSE